MAKPLLAVKVREIAGRRVLAPCDSLTAAWAQDQPLDALLWATVKRPRSPKYHRAIHKLCGILADHVGAFEGLTGHSVLKRLQLESGLECEEIAYVVPKFGTVVQKIPRSIRFEEMDEAEFREFSNRLIDHVAANYWPEFGMHLLKQPEAA